ncbi:MAG TPA: hypothetical protein VJM49_00765, partial [Acidimicrobiales bacterium]|nr:hypothetical protein [Acidimicrobiales bacterium]
GDDEAGSSPAGSPSSTTTEAPASPAVGDDCPAPSEPAPVDGPSAPLEQIGEADGVTVGAAVYPLPEGDGNPWSQWGQGVVLPDGRFVSALGDHLGRDGNSWFYEFDPATGALTRTADVAASLGHEPGDWGYGKVHAPMVLGPCDEVITASYWGTRTDLEIGGSYQGDHLLRYDPATHELASLGVPVAGFGIPSLAISPDRRWIFGEAVDPASDTEDDKGAFFVADSTTGEVTFQDDSTEHTGFRTILVTGEGEALYAAQGGGLFGMTPGADAPRRLDGVLPGDWMRTSSPRAPDGTAYGITVEPDVLFRVAPDGTVTEMGPVEGYTASLGLSPDGGTLYYMPGAHGDAFEAGAPLIAVDTASGEHRTVIELQDMVEQALDLRVGGTYDVVVDPGGDRIYLGVNAGPAHPANEDEDDTFGTIVLLVIDLP